MGYVPAFEALEASAALSHNAPSLSSLHAASVSYLCQSAHPALPNIPSFSWSQVIIQHEAQFTILKSFYFASLPCRSMPLRLATWPDRDRPRSPRRPSGLSTRAITAQRHVPMRPPHV